MLDEPPPLEREPELRVEGAGRFHGRATVVVLRPAHASAAGAFDYHC